MKRLLFTVAQIVWGAPQTLLGFVLYVATVGCPRFNFHGARATVWNAQSSVSLGLFIFVAENPLKQGLAITKNPATSTGNQTKATYVDQRLVAHEYGHCIQSLIFGPLYLLVFGLPSFIWAMLPVLRKHRRRTGKSYYSFYTERFANYLAECTTNIESLN